MASSILPWLRGRQLLQRGWRMPGGAIANLLLLGRRASCQFRRRVCSWGQLGLPRLGMEYYLATPEPPPGWFGLPTT